MGKKRASGEGYVQQRKNGSWRAQVMDGRDSKGKKIIRSFSGPTKADVLRQLREHQQRKDAHIRTDGTVTFEAWANRWYKDYEDQVAASTWDRYRYTLATLTREFGHMPIEDILPMHITALLTRLASEGVSVSTTSKCRAMLIQIFDAAVDNCIVLRNPARAAKRIRRGASATPEENTKDAFTVDEIRTLFQKLPSTLLGNSIRLLIVTGMRIQELLALTAEDIAEDGSSIRINKAVKMVAGKALLGPPKSKSGNRTIPVAQEYRPLAVYLRQHGAAPFLWKARIPGRPYSVSLFRKHYYAALSHIPEVRKLSPHCCRHTYITVLQSRGISMELIARLVGHSSTATTVHYLHVSEDTLQSAVEVLNDV